MRVRIATNLAAAGGAGLVGLLSRAGYKLEREGSGGQRRFSRCLACPMCCLNDGVRPTGNRAMPFSPRHAAAFAGHEDVLRQLEEEGHAAAADADPGRGGGSLAPRWPLPARQMLYEPRGASSSAGDLAAETSSGDRGGWGERPSLGGTDSGDCDIQVVSGEVVTADPEGFFDRFLMGGTRPGRMMRADSALAKLPLDFTRAALLAKLGEACGRWATYLTRAVQGARAASDVARRVRRRAYRSMRGGRLPAVHLRRALQPRGCRGPPLQIGGPRTDARGRSTRRGTGCAPERPILPRGGVHGGAGAFPPAGVQSARLWSEELAAHAAAARPLLDAPRARVAQVAPSLLAENATIYHCEQRAETCSCFQTCGSTSYNLKRPPATRRSSASDVGPPKSQLNSILSGFG